GQFVDRRRRRGWQLPARHDAVALELTEAVGDQVRAGARQRTADVGEPLGPEQQLAHHEQRPAFPDRVQRAGDGAGVPVAPARRHGANLQLCGCFYQPQRRTVPRMSQPVVHSEIIGTDPARLRGYYGELFGWEFDTGGPVVRAVSERGNYGFTEP